MAEENEDRADRIILKDIHSRVWEHPADRTALSALKKVKGIDTAIQTLVSFLGGGMAERSLYLMFLASSVKVSEQQFKNVWRLHREVCETFDVDRVPPLFVSNSPFINAGAVGFNKPFIMLNSSTVEGLDDKELRVILGHELGHIMSGHATYLTLMRFLEQVAKFVNSIPLGVAAIFAIRTALHEWSRKAELSCDRAGLLAAQKPDVSVRLLMKLAGGKKTELMDLRAFIEQAEEYNNAGGIKDNIYKILNVIGQTHPFPVIRVLELMNWVRSGEYDRILSKRYTAKADHEEEVFENFKDAQQSYKQDFQETMRSFMDDERFGKANQKAKDLFGDLFGNRKES
jgi:Zn-dependent protease with chaperone function